MTQDFYDREGADEVQEYVAALPVRRADAAEVALAAARPARVRGGSGRCHIGVNRDLVHEGRVVTGPNPAGFTNPRVDVLRVDGGTARRSLRSSPTGRIPRTSVPGTRRSAPTTPG